MSAAYERRWESRRGGGRAGRSAGDEARDSYYGVPLIHGPHWKWLVILYFFFGGIAGASYVVASVAQFLGGDLVCHGGRVLMQNTHDCNIQDYAASIFKVEPLRFDALLPGHGSISLRDGSRHVALAAAAFRRLGLPENAL